MLSNLPRSLPPMSASSTTPRVLSSSLSKTLLLALAGRQPAARDAFESAGGSTASNAAAEANLFDFFSSLPALGPASSPLLTPTFPALNPATAAQFFSSSTPLDLDLVAVTSFDPLPSSAQGASSLTDLASALLTSREFFSSPAPMPSVSPSLFLDSSPRVTVSSSSASSSSSSRPLPRPAPRVPTPGSLSAPILPAPAAPLPALVLPVASSNSTSLVASSSSSSSSSSLAAMSDSDGSSDDDEELKPTAKPKSSKSKSLKRAALPSKSAPTSVTAVDCVACAFIKATEDPEASVNRATTDDMLCSTHAATSRIDVNVPELYCSPNAVGAGGEKKKKPAGLPKHKCSLWRTTKSVPVPFKSFSVPGCSPKQFHVLQRPLAGGERLPEGWVRVETEQPIVLRLLRKNHRLVAVAKCKPSLSAFAREVGTGRAEDDNDDS